MVWSTDNTSCRTGQAAINLLSACGNTADPYRPFLGVPNITRLENQANSIYHALQFSGGRSIGSLNLTAAYTYSHSIDDASDRYDGTIRQFLRSNFSPCEFQLRSAPYAECELGLRFAVLQEAGSIHTPARRMGVVGHRVVLDGNSFNVLRTAPPIATMPAWQMQWNELASGPGSDFDIERSVCEPSFIGQLLASLTSIRQRSHVPTRTYFWRCGRHSMHVIPIASTSIWESSSTSLSRKARRLSSVLRPLTSSTIHSSTCPNSGGGGRRTYVLSMPAGGTAGGDCIGPGGSSFGQISSAHLARVMQFSLKFLSS